MPVLLSQLWCQFVGELVETFINVEVHLRVSRNDINKEEAVAVLHGKQHFLRRL